MKTAPPSTPAHSKRSDAHFNAIALAWAVSAGLGLFFSSRGMQNPADWLFAVAASVTYATAAIAPLLLLALKPSRLGRILIVILGAVTILLIASSYKLYSMYGFHLNGFVLNLLLTPGGVASLGADRTFFLHIAYLAALFVVVYLLSVRFLPLSRAMTPLRRNRRNAAAIFVSALLLQGTLYAHAHLTGNTAVLTAGDKLFLFQPIYANETLKQLGFHEGAHQVALTQRAGGKLNYPNEPLSFNAENGKPYNIVWLVAESWRWDMLDEAIMPQTWNFSRQAARFTHHYSGGNGTRMGVFTMFTGLYGSYWFDFLNERRSPVLIDTLIDRNYAIKAFTSAKFSYPEFDRTIFSRLRADQLQSFDDGPSWQRDRKNAGDLIDFIDRQTGPFFTFLFLESPHAKYDFPDESIIEPDYLDNFDYSTADIGQQIERIKHRYINACRHLDSQLGRIVDHLATTGLLENTIVLITGDHGEEFMEKGRWGHNSTFAQEQIRVPLIIYRPGAVPADIDALTSHLDIPATLLTLLGAQSPSSHYSYGQDLFAADYHRDYTVLADWQGLGLVTPSTKINLSPKAANTQRVLTTIDDAPYDTATLSQSDQSALTALVGSIHRFYQ